MIDSYMTLRFDPSAPEEMLEHASAVWERFAPGWPIELFFLDQEWERHYQEERRLSRMMQYLTLVTLLIAGLGLLALSGFSYEKRKKEMSIRKVLGANLADISQLLGLEFVKVVTLSLAIGMPVGWLWSNQWLSRFAYRVDVPWWLFVVLAVGLLAISLGLISYHVLRSGRLNPVEQLKSD